VVQAFGLQSALQTESLHHNLRPPTSRVELAPMPRIGFWPRTISLVIDLFILLVFRIVVMLFLAPDASLPQRVHDDMAAKAEYLGNIIAAAFWVVLGLCEAFFAAAPGKMVMRLEIANANATKAQPRTLWLRWLAKNAAALPILAAAIIGSKYLLAFAGTCNGFVAFGCLMALRATHQAWHDQWANTAVFLSRRVLVPLPPAPQPQQQTGAIIRRGLPPST
jgi:uncharacterized RDD family membrane protein YckC